MALCWAGFILVFFTFSTTQEYYSMPCYPALALLLGSAIASGDRVAAVGDAGRWRLWRRWRRRRSGRFCGWCGGWRRRGILRRH